jgi:hypothetical protein
MQLLTETVNMYFMYNVTSDSSLQSSVTVKDHINIL